MLPCSVFWRVQAVGLMASLHCGTGMGIQCFWGLQPIIQPSHQLEKKTFLKQSKSIGMLSSKGCCRWVKGKPWWDMKPQLMPNSSIMSYVKMLSDLPFFHWFLKTPFLHHFCKDWRCKPLERDCPYFILHWKSIFNCMNYFLTQPTSASETRVL